MLRKALLPIGFGLVYFVLAALPIAYSRFGGGVALIWVATPFLAARLRVTPRARWPHLLAAAGVASFLATGLFGLGWAVAGPLMLLNLLDAAVVALTFGEIRRRIESNKAYLPVPWFVLGSLTGPLVTMIPAGIFAQMATHTPLFDNIANWAIGHTLGNLTLGPSIYLAMRGGRIALRRGLRSRRGLFDTVLIAVSLAAILVTFAQDRVPLLFLPLLALVALTYRAGPLGAAAGTIALAGIGGTFTAMGHGSIGMLGVPPATKAQFFEFYLSVTALTLMPLANALAARGEALEVVAESEARYRLLADNLNDIVIAMDLHGRATFVSPAVRFHFGYDPAELVGRNLVRLIDSDYLESVARAHGECIAARGRPILYEYLGVTRDGRRQWFETNARANLDDRGRPVGVIASVREISGRKALQDALARAALTDQLTGLPNRRQFFETCDAIMAAPAHDLGSDAPATLGCLALFDLDHFKVINDRFGHAAGDEVLRAVARIGLRSAAATGTFARLGGEEFALLMPGVTLEGAEAVCTRLLERIAVLGVMWDSHEIRVTASAGVAELRDSCDATLRRADAALYRSKSSGRATLSRAA